MASASQLPIGLLLRTSLACMLTLLSINVLAQAQNDTCSNPTSRAVEGKPKDEHRGDNPAGRSGWFANGRRPGAPGLSGGGILLTPAQRLLQALQQLAGMPGRSGLSGAPEPWNPVGPAPQASLYWGNVSGRVTSVAADPVSKNLYVGTASGGLWKTNDYSNPTPTYTALSDTVWPSLAVGAIALDVSAPGGGPATIYVGTGESNDSLDSYYGVGILKSTDGGTTWSLTTGAGGLTPLPSAQYNLNGPFVGASISRILVDPIHHAHVLAGVASSPMSVGQTPKTAVYESNDGGKTWQAIAVKGGVVTYNTTDLIFSSGVGSFYAAIQGLGIFRLDSQAHQWIPTGPVFASTAPTIQNFYRASIATRSSGAKPEIFALISSGNYGDYDPRNYDLSKPGATDTGIVRSTDGGLTWTPINPPTGLFGDGQGFYDQWIAAPQGSTELVLGGVDIWIAPDETGANWANVSNAYAYGDGIAHPERHIHPDQHAIALLDPQHWIVGNDGGVWRTDDAGTSWVDLNTNISSIQLTSATALGSGPASTFLGGSQDNGTTLSGPPGQPWLTTLTGDGGFTSSTPGEPNRYFTERFYVSLCRSDDGGKNWTTVVDDTTITDRSPFYVPYQVLHGTKDEVILGTQMVWLGDAAPATPGNSWHPISAILSPSGFIQAIASAPSAPQTVYVVTSDSLVYSNQNIHAVNASLKWVALSQSNLPTDRVFSAVAVDPKNPRTAYLAVQGFGTGHLFRTTNGGGKWLDITPSLQVAGAAIQIDTPINSILIDPAFPADLYIATDIGVFSSMNGGTSWQPHGSALPRTAVVELKMTADRRIIAATHGRGLWIISPLHQVLAGGHK